MFNVFVYGVTVFLSLSAGCGDSPRNSNGDQPIEVAIAQPKSFDIQVATIGVLDAARAHMLSSDIRGDYSKIIFIINDGTHVKKGDLLVKIDQTPFEDRVEELTAEVAALESAYKAKEQMLEWEKNQVEKNLSNARYNQTLAKLEYKRLIEGDGPLQVNQYKTEVARAKEEVDKYVSYHHELEQLKDEGYSNPSELSTALKRKDEYKEKYETAQKALESYQDHVYPSLKQAALAKMKKTEADILQAANDGVINIAKATATLEEAKGALNSRRAALKQARNELKKVELRAPFDGIAILYETFRDGEKRKPRVGDRIIRNQPILYLPDISTMIVKTDIREVDLHKISLDQTAQVQVDAYPDARLQGKVGFIGALAAEVRGGGTGGKFFQCMVNILTRDLRLRPGMTSRVTILSGQVKDALCVPVSALFIEDGGCFCYRAERGGFERITVKTGRQNLDYVEIVSGLDPDDRVALTRPEPYSYHHAVTPEGS